MDQPGMSSDPEPSSGVGEFGYKQEMKRELGPFSSFALAFGFVSIATGTFTSYQSMLQTSGPRGVWSWIFVIVGQILVAFVFGALAARIPVSGYSYQWVSRLANPILGWIMGWISFTFLAVVVVAVDYTIASTILPNLFGYAGTAVHAWLITAAIMAIQTVSVVLSTSVTQRLNNIAVGIQIAGMFAIVILLYGVGIATHEFDWQMLFNTGGIPEAGYFSLGTANHAGPFAMAFLAGAFTIVGFESAANLSEETKDAEHVIPKAMVQAVVALGVIGFLFVVGATALIDDPVTLAQSPTALADIITHTLGGFAGKALLVLVVISIYSCGSTITMSGSRMVWALARDERFPGYRWLKIISPRWKTPAHAAVFMLIVSQTILGVFTYLSTDALFSLFSAGTLLPALIYAGTVLLYWIKRKHLPPSKGMTLGKWELPVLIGASIWLVYELLIFRDSSFAEVWIYVLVLFGIGAIYLAYLLITRGKDGLAMPEMSDVDKELDTLSDASKETA
jgi:amino acid transporter